MLETIRVGDIAVTAAQPEGGGGAAQRPPLLFVHGYMGSAWIFERYQRFFAERGWTSWALNLRGRAGSEPAAGLGRATIADYVSDALGVARALADRHWVQRPVVLGHSMGGLIGQKLAEVGMANALVLLCSAPPRGISFLTPRLLGLQLRYILPMLRGRPISAPAPNFAYYNCNCVPAEEHDALFARACPDSTHAGRAMLFGLVAVDESRVRCPVLAVTGAEDRFFPPRVGRRLAEKYGAEYVELAGRGHLVPCEPGWEESADLIERWVARATVAAGDAPRSSPVVPAARGA